MPQILQKLVERIAHLEVQIGHGMQFARIKDAKPNFVKCVLGKDGDGKDVESDWIPVIGYENHGKVRDGNPFTPGSTVFIMRPRGRQDSDTVAIPGGANKDYLRPDHASKDGKDEYTSQFGPERTKRTEKEHETFFLDPQQKQQNQQQTTKSPNGSTASVKDKHWHDLLDEANQREGDYKNSALSKHRVTKTDITSRIGKNSRVAVNAKGAKFRVGNNIVVVTEDKVIVKSVAGDLYLHGSGNIYVNKPPELNSAPNDPIPQDDT
jgi:hypothetical protein